MTAALCVILCLGAVAVIGAVVERVRFGSLREIAAELSEEVRRDSGR